MDSTELAKHIMDLIQKTNDLKVTIGALDLVHSELQKQLQTNLEKAKKELEFHTTQRSMFNDFLGKSMVHSPDHRA